MNQFSYMNSEIPVGIDNLMHWAEISYDLRSLRYFGRTYPLYSLLSVINYIVEMIFLLHSN